MADRHGTASCPDHGRHCWHGPCYRGARRDHRAALRRDAQDRAVRYRRRRKPVTDG